MGSQVALSPGDRFAEVRPGCGDPVEFEALRWVAGPEDQFERLWDEELACIATQWRLNPTWFAAGDAISYATHPPMMPWAGTNEFWAPDNASEIGALLGTLAEVPPKPLGELVAELLPRVQQDSSYANAAAIRKALLELIRRQLLLPDFVPIPFPNLETRPGGRKTDDEHRSNVSRRGQRGD